VRAGGRGERGEGRGEREEEEWSIRLQIFLVARRVGEFLNLIWFLARSWEFDRAS